MATVTRAAQVEAAIRKIGGTAKLYRGPGYWYFDGDDVQWAYSTSVMTPYLSDSTLESWLNEYRRIAASPLTAKHVNLTRSKYD